MAKKKGNENNKLLSIRVDMLAHTSLGWQESAEAILGLAFLVDTVLRASLIAPRGLPRCFLTTGRFGDGADASLILPSEEAGAICGEPKFQGSRRVTSRSLSRVAPRR